MVGPRLPLALKLPNMLQEIGLKLLTLPFHSIINWLSLARGRGGVTHWSCLPPSKRLVQNNRNIDLALKISHYERLLSSPKKILAEDRNNDTNLPVFSGLKIKCWHSPITFSGEG